MTQTIGAAHPNPPTIPTIENLTRRQRRFEKPQRSQRITAAWLIAPAAVLGITFVLIPIALTFALAFTNAKLVSPQGPQFVGVDNFTRLFGDPVFWKSLRNTVLFAIFVVPIQAGLALAPGAADQREGQGRQLLPHRVLPAGGHLDGRHLDAVDVHVPARTG